MPPPEKRTLDQWLRYFDTLHPVGIDMGLSRVAAVWKTLCQHHQITRLAGKKTITVSGTNGKGSVCQMLSLLLHKKDGQVGVYTSPHIHHFNERIQINGQAVDEQTLIRAFAAIETARGEISLSYFEATTLAGLLVFAWKKVDYAILEVGLGGRLDAVNIIAADAAILTSVGLDHSHFLGNDIEAIALEKAAVFRPDKPAVYAETGVYQSVLQYTDKHRVLLLVNGRDYRRSGQHVSFHRQTYRLPAALADWGEQQLQNAAAAVVLLVTLGCLPDNYQQRLADFSLPGRLQPIAQSPLIIVDVAHNVAAAEALANHIRRQAYAGNVFAVIGMLKDKDHDGVLSVCNGLFQHIYFASTDGQRGYDGRQLHHLYQRQNPGKSSAYPTLTEALKAAKRRAKKEDVIYAFGSFSVVKALTERSRRD